MKRCLLLCLCVVVLVLPIYASTAVSGDTIVYVTPSGQKYHKKSCSYTKKARKNGTLEEITIAEAVEKGLTPCSRCRPGKWSVSKKRLVVVPKEPEHSLQTTESVGQTSYLLIGSIISGAGFVVLLVAYVWTHKKRRSNMGVITYTKGKYPAFLTFHRYTSLLDTCVDLGLITEDERQRCDLFSHEVDRKVSNVFTKYLADLEKSNNAEYMRNYCKFFCSKEEAKDNLCRLLDAAGHLHESSKILPSFLSTTFGFIPIREDDIGIGYYGLDDIRFPFGERYWFVSIGPFRKITAQVLIDSEQVDFFSGSLHQFHIVFQNGMHVEFDHGNLIIRPNPDTAEIFDEFLS